MTGLLLPATVLLSTTLLFTTHRSYAGLDRGNSSPASLMLQRAGASPATPAAGPAFEKTYWKATELVGKPVREALQKTGRWKIVGNELELSDIGGSRLARFDASADK